MSTQELDAQPTVGLNPEQINTYLSTLFAPTDIVKFRPAETWTEDGEKRSRVLYQHITAIPQKAWLKGVMTARVEALKTEHASAFVGVCPRQTGAGTFELAWQIATVRCLWADVYGCGVEEVLRRVKAAGLPEPTIVVSSGRGTQIYWALSDPVLTEASSLGVFEEWTKINEKKKRIRFIVVDDEKIWLDSPITGKTISSNHPMLTELAQRVQDACQGIAAAIGGNHAQDLSRLLPLPGTLNRRNGRNGSAPRPIELVSCNAGHVYSFESFAKFADQAPAKIKRDIVATIPLPVKRPLTAAKTDTLNEKVVACATAVDRSGADFHLCCWAIEKGVSKADVRSVCQNVGRFAERGEDYFEATWSRAEVVVRAKIYEKIQPRDETVKRQRSKSNHNPDEDWNKPETGSSNDANEVGRPTIYVDPVNSPVAHMLRMVTKRLISVGNVFSRAEQIVVIHKDEIRSVLSAQEFAGLLSEHVEFFFVKDESGEFKPLPSAYGNTWLNNHVQRRCLPTISLFTRNPVYTEDWRLVAPGYDKLSGIYYAGPAVEPRQDTTHLDILLRDFCFKSPGDRTNYIAMLITALLIPRFIGSKPAALFNGNQPELGKTILAQIIATLRDGHPAETATYNPNDEEFEKRLGAIVRRGVTTIIIDNAKGRTKNPRIESACLERSITDPILSFRLLGHSSDIRAENSHIFCITANTSDVSRDLITRSTVINLYHEGDPEHRVFSIADPESYAEKHRNELLGELVGMVEKWKAAGSPMSKANSRFNKRGWAAIVGGILEANGEPDFLLNAAEAATQLDDTRREFAELVAILADHPRGIWTATELVELCGKHGLLTAGLGEGSERSLATKMGTLSGRFVTESFPLEDGRSANFRRVETRKGFAYQVFVKEESPNPDPNAEPLPNP